MEVHQGNGEKNPVKQRENKNSSSIFLLSSLAVKKLISELRVILFTI
jgi:hypothetical protein